MNHHPLHRLHRGTGPEDQAAQNVPGIRFWGICPWLVVVRSPFSGPSPTLQSMWNCRQPLCAHEDQLEDTNRLHLAALLLDLFQNNHYTKWFLYGNYVKFPIAIYGFMGISKTLPELAAFCGEVSEETCRLILDSTGWFLIQTGKFRDIRFSSSKGEIPEKRFTVMESLAFYMPFFVLPSCFQPWAEVEWSYMSRCQDCLGLFRTHLTGSRC